MPIPVEPPQPVTPLPKPEPIIPTNAVSRRFQSEHNKDLSVEVSYKMFYPCYNCKDW